MVDVVQGNEIVSNVRMDKIFALRKQFKEGSAEGAGDPHSIFTIEYKAEEDRQKAIRFMRRNKSEAKAKNEAKNALGKSKMKGMGGAGGWGAVKNTVVNDSKQKTLNTIEKRHHTMQKSTAKAFGRLPTLIEMQDEQGLYL